MNHGNCGKIVLFIALLGLLLVFLLAGCSADDNSLAPTSSIPTGTLKIGVMLPLTGVNADLGWSLQQAIQLAVDEESGQVAGRTIKLIIEDEGDRDSAVALDKAKKLVESDKIDLMLGPVAPKIASAVLPYLASKPVIDVKFTAPLSNEETRTDFVFWTAPRYQDYTYPLGIFLANEGLKTVSSIGSDSPEGTGYLEGFVTAFQNLGGKLISQQWVPITSTNFAAEIGELRNSDATASAILGDDGKIVFLNEYQQLGLLKDAPLVMLEPNSFSQKVIQAMNDEFIGTLGIQGYTRTLNNPANIKFVQDYQSKYNSTPDKQICEAYNGMRVVIEALKATHGNASPAVLKQALLNLQIDLPTGQFRFSQSRTGLQPLRVYSIQKVNGVLQWVIEKEYPAAEYYHVPAAPPPS
jgi:branched-chain amino acid transport system substrate-binding protein